MTHFLFVSQSLGPLDEKCYITPERHSFTDYPNFGSNNYVNIYTDRRGQSRSYRDFNYSDHMGMMKVSHNPKK